MKKHKHCLSIILAIVSVISAFSFGTLTAGAEIPEGITIPSFQSLQSYVKLHDPFKFINGTYVTGKEQWESRRQEISAYTQAFLYGVKPDKPDNVNGSISSNNLTVTCTENGKNISLKCTIQYPTAGKAPYPAMIAMRMPTLNNAEILKMGVAIITFPCEPLANVGTTRSSGLFYDLYGSNHSAGILMAWAWGVSRVIDALEITPSAKIDAKHIGVTGGARFGRGALCAAAFDERIALAIPQESGIGSSGSFRIAEAMRITSASGIVAPDEARYFGLSGSFEQFKNQINKLPLDIHLIHALCAPLALLFIENTDYAWLGVPAAYSTVTASRIVYDTLGVRDNMGFSAVGGHEHCMVPNAQYPDVNAYIKKFLLDDNTANTGIFKSDVAYTFDKAKWIEWKIPNLLATPTNKPIDTPEPITNEDINNDGVVNMGDIMLIAGAFNSITGSVAYNGIYDLDKDGVVNMNDIMKVAAKFNRALV